MARIIDFQNLDQVNLDEIPGKIRRLYKQFRAGIRVPDRGFVIFPAVVEDILAHAGDVAALTPDQFPDHVRNELRAAYAAYRSAQFAHYNIPVAVRAALNVEDNERASYAGGSESFTNVVGVYDFLAAVAQCIVASFSGRMDAYREHHGIGQELKLYILVHNMVPDKANAVGEDKFVIVFTRNPFGHEDEVLVQATFGGGEPLTSGSETGDLYVLERSGKLLRKTIATKRVMSTPQGLAPVPCHIRENQTLDEKQLAKLVAFALRIEELEHGEPQDCEIAIETSWGALFPPVLIQNRPITTHVAHDTLIRAQFVADASNKVDAALGRLSALGVEVPETVYSDQNIVELLTRNPSQMAFGMFTYIFAHGDGGIRVGRNCMGYDIGPELDSGFFELIAGQPRCSIVHDALTYRIAGIPLSDYVAGFVAPYLEAIRKDPKLANYPEVVLYEQSPSLDLLADRFGEQKAHQYHECYQRFFAGIRRLERTFADEYRTRHTQELNRFLARYRDSELELLSVSEIAREAQELLEFLRTRMCVWFVIAARLGFFAYARLRKRFEGRYDTREASRLLDTVTAGMRNDPTIEFNIALAHVRDGMRSLQSVLDEYGHLGFNELEIAGPRFHENVELVELLIRNLRSDPAKEFSERAAGYERARVELEEAFGDEREELGQDIASARTYLALRETVKFQYLKLYDLIRSRLRAAEQTLGWSEGDVFFLDPREVSLLSDDSAEALRLARERRKLHHEARNFEVPKVLFSNELHHIDTTALSLPESVVELSGLGGSPFVAEGRAVIVYDPNDIAEVKRVGEGSILVVPSTDPAWSPIICAIGKTGGLITEVGGPLAHGAIVCREMGNAAVVDVPNATRIIRDGERVRIDGRDPQNGRVYLLER